MQVKVAAAPAAAAFNLTALNNAFKHHADGSGVFESSQDPIIVGQAGYNSAYGKTFAASGDCTDPPAPTSATASARIAQQGGQDFRFDTLKGPQLQGHDRAEGAPRRDELGRLRRVRPDDGQPRPRGRAGDTGRAEHPALPVHRAADGGHRRHQPAAGRHQHPARSARAPMAPRSGRSPTTAWTPTRSTSTCSTCSCSTGSTWDNIIIPTEPSELGWKETIRVSPLEDTIVALRPIVPTLPFEVPNSIRPLSPMMPLGANLDPTGSIVAPTGNASTLRNALVNFGWEYVYHCHILSHEEMDMMRPVLLAVPPLKADMLAFDQPTKTLSWNDNSITETSFVVQKSPDGITWPALGVGDVGSIVSPLDQPNIHQVRSLVDRMFDPAVPTYYRVVALNMVGTADSATTGYSSTTVKSFSAPLLVGLLTTTTLTSDVNPSLVGQNVTFTATVTSTFAGIPTGTVQFSIDGVNVGTPVTLDASGVATYATSTLIAGSHPVVATYNGVLPFGGSSGSLTQVVNQAGTATALTSSLNPSTSSATT